MVYKHQWIFFLSLVISRPMYCLIEPELVKIQSINPTIIVDLFLADECNFLGEVQYPTSATAYIDKGVALKLDAIQKELAAYGLGIKIKDAYRPLFVQKRLWEIALAMNLSDPGNYISDPDVEGGRHPRGVAVDLTLVRLSDGQELSMPPMEFSERAHRDFAGLDDEKTSNRDFLRSVMEKHGFVGISCEWWHYNLPNWFEYEVVNLSFEELSKEWPA